MASAPSQREETLFTLRQAFKLALSLVLFYAFALWTNWDVPRYGGLAIVIVSLGTHGASLKQGLMRIAGTTAGVLIGVAVLSLFGDDRWATMLALATNIGLMCYGMQTSHYRYAWYAAGFIPLIVFADNYPHFNDAFYFSTFRWLETVVGVTIYTLVDLIFWPRSASVSLRDSGKELIHGLQQLLDAFRGEQALTVEQLSPLRAQVGRQLSLTLASMQDAQFDTPAVSRTQKFWGIWREELVQFIQALELYHQSALDCGELAHQLAPQSNAVLDRVDARLTQIATLWDQWLGNAAAGAPDDRVLTHVRAVDLDRHPLPVGSEFQRVAWMSAVKQLKLLDEASDEMLNTTRLLTGAEEQRLSTPSNRHGAFPMLWDPARFVQALFPVVTFITAWLVWDLTNPPGGAKVAMLAGLLAIMVVRTPMNPLMVWVGMILSTAFVVAPVSWLIMPALSTGTELLTLIFLLSFVFACLGAKSPALKSGVLIQFFASAGISNQQSYSFEGPVNGSLMVLIGGGVVTVIYNLWFPIRPDQSLLRSLRRTLAHFSNGMRSFDWEAKSVEKRQQRHRQYLLAAKLPNDLRELRHAVDTLSFAPYANNTKGDWLKVVDSLQYLAFRMQSFADVYQTSFAEGTVDRSPLAEKGKRAMNAISKMILAWSTLDRQNDDPGWRSQLEHLQAGLQAKVSDLFAVSDQGDRDQQRLANAYTILGDLWTVVHAIEATHRAFEQVDCDEIATPRF